MLRNRHDGLTTVEPCPPLCSPSTTRPASSSSPQALHDLGWSLVSSGGTARAIAEPGTPVTDVAELTGLPAILGHRVVTLHPKIHGGMLADPTDPEHVADMEQHGIEPIDLVVVNLYPFSSDPGIELIDIGGPAMVRAAAKNHAHVGVVVDPADYATVLDEIGAARDAQRRHQAPAGADRVRADAAYDAAIVDVVRRHPGGDRRRRGGRRGETALPGSIHLALELAQPLRYGENPHQQGARYRQVGATSWWDSMTQHGGKELSYLNVFDTEAAWRLVHRFDAPAVVDREARQSVRCRRRRRHHRGLHPRQRLRPGQRVRRHRRRQPDGDRGDGRGDRRRVHRGGRRARLRTRGARDPRGQEEPARDVGEPGVAAARSTCARSTAACWSSSPIRSTARRSTWRVVTVAQPTDAQWADLEFAWQVCAAVSSNAIVYAKDLQAFGIGAGQQNRLDSARIAAERSAGRADGGACASDAFFPFRDGLDAAAAAGIASVIQPGGSVRDDEVIAAADEHGIAMVFTGQRHFRH